MKIEDKVFKCIALQYALLKDYVGSESDFTDKCIHCKRSIYMDYEKLLEDTGKFGVSMGYTLKDASSKLLKDCPHCGKKYRGMVLDMQTDESVLRDIKDLLKGLKYYSRTGDIYAGVDRVLNKYSLALDSDLNIIEL